MNNDNQIKHHIWWIIKTIGKLPKEYKDFIKEPLSDDICRDIDALVKHIKENY